MSEFDMLIAMMLKYDVAYTQEQGDFYRAVMKATLRRLEAEAELAEWEAKSVARAYREGR